MADCGPVGPGSCEGTVRDQPRCTATSLGSLVAPHFGIDACRCDSTCHVFDDCCADKFDVCGGEGEPVLTSCEGRCYTPGLDSNVWNLQTCACGKGCEEYGDCCHDYVTVCAPAQTDPLCAADDCTKSPLQVRKGSQGNFCYCDFGCVLRRDCCGNHNEVCL